MVMLMYPVSLLHSPIRSLSLPRALRLPPSLLLKNTVVLDQHVAHHCDALATGSPRGSCRSQTHSSGAAPTHVGGAARRQAGRLACAREPHNAKSRRQQAL